MVALAILALLPSARTVPVILLDPPLPPVRRIPAEQRPKQCPKSMENDSGGKYGTKNC
jgi:hypothetical protein